MGNPSLRLSEVLGSCIGDSVDVSLHVLILLRLNMLKVYVRLCSYYFRFIVFILGPKGISNYVEIGRCIATMMIDEVS